ncbi:MAG: transposase [Oscillospiraceae bacterium]|nr:transposase [Oscillospiraceae bacterium]
MRIITNHCNRKKVEKSPMGWFYGFKLHLVINGYGEILSFCLNNPLSFLLLIYQYTFYPFLIVSVELTLY